MTQVEIRCPSCKSLLMVPWVQNSYAAVCPTCGNGIADLRPHLTQPAPIGASISSVLIAGSALVAPEAAKPQPQAEILASLVRETQPQNADGNAPTVFGAKPVTAAETPAEEQQPVAEAETMRMPRPDIATQPTRTLPEKPDSNRLPGAMRVGEDSAFSSSTGKLKIGRVGHSLTGETKIRRRERLERGKKKVFESWVSPPGVAVPAGNSGHFAPPTAAASKTRAISYRDLRSSSSTAYLDSLRAAAEAARVKKGVSKRVLPAPNSANEAKELEKFLEEANRTESARQAAVSAAPAPESATLGNLTFNTNIPKEEVIAREPELPGALPRVDAAETSDPLELKASPSEGSLPPAARVAAVIAAAAVAPSAPDAHRSAAEIEEENDPGARRISTRSIINKQTELKSKPARKREGPRFENLGYRIVAGIVYVFMALSVVAFALAIVHQYFTPLWGLPRL